MKRAKRHVPYVVSSGNVFRDLRLPNSDEELTKSSLLWEISEAIRARGLKQVEAAEILGIPQPQVSVLLRGRTAGFSVQRLSVLLGRLGKSVTIVVSDEAPASGPARIPVVRDSAGLVARLTRDLVTMHAAQSADYAPARARVSGETTKGRRSITRKKK